MRETLQSLGNRVFFSGRWASLVYCTFSRWVTVRIDDRYFTYSHEVQVLTSMVAWSFTNCLRQRQVFQRDHSIYNRPKYSGLILYEDPVGDWGRFDQRKHILRRGYAA